MNIQVAYINMHLFEPLCVFICALFLIYTQIYAYLGAFWIVFGHVLHQLGQVQVALYSNGPYTGTIPFLVYSGEHPV